jgi:predicted DNA-binding transcriptional regulator YafY
VSTYPGAVGISKVERLMNLVIALLSTRTYITAERIRRVVAGYADCSTDEAFSRMFERDKNELRDLGIRWRPVGCRGSIPPRATGSSGTPMHCPTFR